MKFFQTLCQRGEDGLPTIPHVAHQFSSPCVNFSQAPNNVSEVSKLRSTQRPSGNPSSWLGAHRFAPVRKWPPALAGEQLSPRMLCSATLFSSHSFSASVPFPSAQLPHPCLGAASCGRFAFPSLSIRIEKQRASQFWHVSSALCSDSVEFPSILPKAMRPPNEVPCMAALKLWQVSDVLRRGYLRGGRGQSLGAD